MEPSSNGVNMKTKILSANELQTCADILNSGGLVAVPTETVYGLAADALNPTAVKNIFKAKGRPPDNPLIVHISEFSQIDSLVKEIPDSAKRLAETFWPGPLTMILKKSSIVPYETSGGLDTVAIRFPSNEVMRNLIRLTGKPLAAPSANLSGKPSPTKFAHVIKDLNGKIDAIIDGGNCKFGVESTVISLVTSPPRILRPGNVTPEQIKSVLSNAVIDPAVTKGLSQNDIALSPGMKYKHYAPEADIIMVDGSSDDYANYVNSQTKNVGILALCFDEDIKRLSIPYVSYGKENDYLNQANLFFDSLRKIDELSNIKKVYAHCPKLKGVGLAVYNRLIRAAGFNVIKIDNIK